LRVLGYLKQTKITMNSSSQECPFNGSTLWSCMSQSPDRLPCLPSALHIVMTHSIGLAMAPNPVLMSNEILVRRSRFRLPVRVSASPPSPPPCSRHSKAKSERNYETLIAVLSVRLRELCRSLVTGNSCAQNVAATE
jgi:hypothetical protein